MANRSNIVFLLHDHQAYYGHGEMVEGPQIHRPNFNRLANQGMRFTRAYTCCPLCAPARRSILTGVFPHVHGILSNFSFNPFQFETYLERLAKEGYHNYYYGKWHAGHGTAHDHLCEGISYPDYNNPYTKPEYKAYLKEKGLPEFHVKLKRSFIDPNTPLGEKLQTILERNEDHYLDRASSNENSTGLMISPKETHEAFFLAHLACQKLHEIAKNGNQEPFHLRVDFWGPHQPYFATQEFLDLYPPEKIPEPPSFRDNLKDKPKLYKSERGYPLNKYGKLIFPNPLPWSEWQKVFAFNYAQQSLLDEAGGLILNALDELGLNDNTMVVWTADHGDALGCHGGHFDKDGYMPEEMMRIPLAIRYPEIIPAGQESDKLISNLDFPSTFLDCAGVNFSHESHGRSLLPIFSNAEKNWREDLMCETNGHFNVHIGRMIITKGYKYIYNDKDLDELYDLNEDPFELKNIIKSRDHDEILIDLKSRLKKWRQQTEDRMTRKIIYQDRKNFAQYHMDEATLLDR